MSEEKPLQAIEDSLWCSHNMSFEVNQGFDVIELDLKSNTFQENIYDEDLHIDKHWDVIDAQLKEFASPKALKNTSKRNFRNDNKILQFPANLNTINCAYIQTPNSDKFRELRFYYHHHNTKREVAILIIEDEYSRRILRKLINCGLIRNIDNIISHGSESLVLHANFSFPFRGLNQCAIKVYKTKIHTTISSEPYVRPDYKFTELFVNKNTRQVVKQWAKKEFDLLVKMQAVGINAPSPIYCKSHCVLMSFIGDEKRAPSLAELVIPMEKWQYVYTCVLQAVDKLYFEGGFVHGDLNEHNILWWDDKCWFISFSQALPTDHEMALFFLKKDCRNIKQFFQTKYVHMLRGPEKICATVLT
ncbi:serine/threonine-protein kinase RIO3-like [Zerene cesonia]|uniref:serine/threonine-protein kinase RIO3-like n=1 Tax=Zerene cesonia TaxID=33412 RepID=UPI0018E54446|nr:serine/threonine-protein kinase RIO3-like [Zerene cesonia]